jgi:cell pole-organizing protein PopZ
MVKPEPAHNQTVEEILASIRQAISEDETKRGVQRPRGEATAQRQPEKISNLFAGPASDGDDEPGANDSQAQDVIDLAIEKALDGVRAELQVGPDLPDAAGNPPTVAAPPESGPLIQPAPRPEARGQAMPSRNDQRLQRPLLSPRAGAAVSASFDNLARSMSGNGRKLDELVEGMLRPMLRSWLDDNLPLLVERLVREEIERVSRGGR